MKQFFGISRLRSFEIFRQFPAIDLIECGQLFITARMTQEEADHINQVFQSSVWPLEK